MRTASSRFIRPDKIHIMRDAIMVAAACPTNCTRRPGARMYSCKYIIINSQNMHAKSSRVINLTHPAEALVDGLRQWCPKAGTAVSPPASSR